MSKPHVTADTMFFYYLGNGSLKREDIVSSSEELWAAPINILEIISSTEDFSRRVAAARAMLAADNIAPDPNEYLVSLLEGRMPIVDNNWKIICEALASATSEKHLVESIDIVWAVKKRCHDSEAFRYKTIMRCDKFVDGYADACLKNINLPRLKWDNLKNFRDSLQMLQISMLQDFIVWRLDMEKELISRISLFTKEEIIHIIALYYNYITMYTGYIERLLTQSGKPDSNDWGDLELFKYLQTGHYVVTSENKWGAIAKKVGLEDQVRIRKPK